MFLECCGHLLANRCVLTVALPPSFFKSIYLSTGLNFLIIEINVLYALVFLQLINLYPQSVFILILSYRRRVHVHINDPNLYCL